MTLNSLGPLAIYWGESKNFIISYLYRYAYHFFHVKFEYFLSPTIIFI